MKPNIVVALMVAAGMGGAARADREIKNDFLEVKDQAFTKLDPFDVAVYSLEGNVGVMHPAYLADMLGDKYPMLGRTAFLYVCLKADMPTASAVCQGDVEAFDAGKAIAEIDADKAHAELHASAKALVAEVKGMVAAQPAKLKAWADKDDAYKKMFEIAATARKQPYGSAELRSLVLDIDDARRTGSRKALAGCETKVWPQWVKAVSAIPANKFGLEYEDSMSDVWKNHAATIVGTTDGYLAAIAAVGCLPPDNGFEHVRDALNFWPGARGPRNGALTAMRKANLQLDKKDAKIEWPSVDRRQFFGNYETPSGNSQAGRAPVKTVTVQGDKIQLTYGDIKGKAIKCTDYHPGVVPARIDASGNIIYESSCGKYEQVEVNHGAPNPTVDEKRYAEGVKPGVIVSFKENVIHYVMANLQSKYPTVVLGAPVK